MKIGYQLFSAFGKYKNSEELISVIRKIGDIGYDGVEFFLYFDTPAEKMKDVLDEAGLVAVNSHVQMERWEKDTKFEIEYAKKLGMPMLTIPWINPEDRTPECYKTLLPKVREWGKMCQDEGIQLIWHNHNFEFDVVNEDFTKVIEGENVKESRASNAGAKPDNIQKCDAANADKGIYLLDLILSECAPIGWEPDTFWIHKVGLDPAEEIMKRKDRVKLLHIKDYLDKDAQPKPLHCAIGCGKMDFTEVVEKAHGLQLEWLISEQDNTQGDELEDAAVTYETMRNWR